jgi:hypothetical protein
MKFMVVMISDDEAIMKGEHTNDAGIILARLFGFYKIFH